MDQIRPSRMMGDQVSVAALSSRRVGLFICAVELAVGIGLGLGLTSRSAHATSYHIFENRRELRKGFRLIPEIGILSTSENYTHQGTKVPAESVTPQSKLDSYSKTVIDLWGIYGFTEKLTGYARISMAALSYNTVGDSTLQGNASGLTEQGFGLNYRLWEGRGGRAPDGSALRRTAIDLQFQIDLPMYDNVSARAANTPLLGDGSLDITTGAFLTMPMNQGRGSRIYLIAGLAYMMRGNDHSAAIPYQVGFTSIPEGGGFMWKLGAIGFKSMSTDPSAGSALATNANPRIDSGNSLIVNALNSSYTAARATVGFQTRTGSQYYLAYAMMVSGTSTAAANMLTLGAQWRWGGSSARAATPSSGASGQSRPARSGFVSYNLDGRVKVSNDRLNLIKIDKGEQDGVAKGQIFDVFRTKPDGSIDARIARGVVTNLSLTEAIISIKQYAKEVWIQPGFIVRRVVR